MMDWKGNRMNFMSIPYFEDPKGVWRVVFDRLNGKPDQVCVLRC